MDEKKKIKIFKEIKYQVGKLIKVALVFYLLFLLMIKLTPYAGADSYVYSYSPPQENIKFHHLSIADGLSQNTVNTILQDRKGFIWFGTQDGLNRYDGHGFKIYKYYPDDADSLSDNFVNVLFEDQQGLLWVGTRNSGLNRFDPSTERFAHFKHQPGLPYSLSHNEVHTIFTDSQGVLWIGTGGGINRYDRQTNRFIHYRNNPNDANSLSHNSVQAIIEDGEGNLWIGTWKGGLNRFDPATDSFTRYQELPYNPNSLGNDMVSSLQLDASGKLYIGTRNGLTVFHPGTGVFTRYQNPPGTPNSLGDNRINALYMCKDPSGVEVLWIATEKGLSRFYCKTKEIKGFRRYPHVPKSINFNWVYSIYKDREGNLWIGTAVDGVYRIDHFVKPFVNYLQDTTASQGPIDNSIHAVHQDRNGMLWIGTTKGLKGLDRDKNQLISFRHEPGNPHSLSFDEVQCILEDQKGELWIGTRAGGLNRLHQDNHRFIFTRFRHEPGNPNSLYNDGISCLFEDQNGVLWVGTSGGLNTFDTNAGAGGFTNPGYQYNPEAPGSLSDNSVSSIYKDHAEILWIGTDYGGLNRLDRKSQRFTHFKHDPQNPNSLSHNAILCLHEDSQDALWIGTFGGGLNRLSPDRKHFTHFTEKHGLPNNIVYGILEDNEGNLWLSTNKGLSRFNSKTMYFKNYDRSDGLQSNEFDYGAYFKSKSGEMFFGGINGLTAFYPGNIRDNPHIPPVVLTDFLLFNKPVPIGKEIGAGTTLTKSITRIETILLSHKDYIFSFQFAALNYISPGKNRYAYMMEDFDKGWNDAAGRNYATYINLPAGKYRFRVKGSNNDGVWNERGTSVKLIIIPPFWRTWWFRTTVLVVLLGMGYLFYRLRIRSMEQQRKRLEQMVARRTRELQKEREVAEAANRSKSQFLARMSHEIRTPMNAVIGFADMLLDADLKEEAKEFAKNIHISAETLLGVINNILDISKIEAGQLTFDPVDFDPRLTVYDMCELMTPKIAGKPVDISCHIGDRVPALIKSDPGKFRQVVLNLLGNAIKFTKRGKIEVFLDVQKEEKNRLKLHTRVKDTGIGIQADKIERIFEVFQQGNSSTTRKYGGTGLGLAICKQIAKMMQGDAWAESKPGEGSTFHFTAWVDRPEKKPVPKETARVLPDQKGPLSPPVTLREEAGPSIHILLAEDNPINQKMVQYMFSKAGYQLDIVNNGKEAVEAYQSDPGKYDMIFMDVWMPVMDGEEATKEIRRLEAETQKGKNSFRIPIIAVTANAMKGEREKLLELGMDDYIPKPIKREVILRLVEKWALNS